MMQMTENTLSSLKSVIATWQSSSPSLVIDVIFTIVCGMMLFLLLLPWLESNPSLPPARKHRNTKKCPGMPRSRRSRKKSGVLKGELLSLSLNPRLPPPVLSLKARALCLRMPAAEPASQETEPSACRDCLQELEEVRDMIFLLGSRHLGRPPDKGSFCQHSGQDPSGEVCRTAPEGAHRCCGEPVEDASPAISTSASPASLTECLLPLASALSPDPKASSIFVHPHSSLSASQPPEPSLSMDSLSLPHFLSRPPDLEAHPPPPTASSALPPPNSTLTLPQCDSVALPLGINPQSSAPPTPRSASPIPALSGLGHSSSPTLALSLWQLTAKALCLSASSQFKSQEEHLPHHPPEALCRGDPTGRQIDAGSCSLLRSEKQNVLEIQVTKTIKVKIWKEKEKDRLYAKQMNPNAELCTTASQPLGSTKGKPEQLPRPQQLSYHKVLEDHLQTKYDQLFWGLPSLHSESLMVTVWISENFSTLQSPSLLFNGTSNACPIPLQAKLSPLLSHSQPLSYLKFLAQPLISTTPQFQPPPLAQVQTEGHLQSSLPTLPPSSPPHIRVCGVSCPTAQNKPQPLIPVGIQHPEWPLLQKQLETGWDLSCVVRRSHQVFNVFTSNLPKDSSVISIFSENFPISSEVQKQLEQHLQKLLIQQHQELPPKTQESLERRQHEDKSVEACQARGQHGPSQPSSFTGESSKEAQKVGLQVSQDMGKGLGHILGKIPEDLSRGPESTVVMFQRAEPEDSERDWMHLKSDSESDLLRKLDKNIENILKGHLGSKSDSLVPESVHRSWLPVNHSSAKFHTHTETKNLGILKGWEPHVNTSHSISFPDTSTREVLEAHITEFQVKRRWGLPLKVLRPVNLLKLKKAQVSPILQSAYPPSPTCASGAHRIVKCAEFLGKPPQSCPGEDVETEESAPTLVRPLIAPSPVCEEIQRALGGTPSGDDHGPSKASLTKQKDRPPSQSLTLTWQSGPMEQAERGSLDPSPSSAMAMNESRGKSWGQASQDSCNKGKILEMNLRSQSLRAEETRDIVEAKLYPALHPESTLQNKNAHLRSLKAPRTSTSPPVPRMSILHDPAEPCLNKELINAFKFKVKVQSKSQPQDCLTQMPLAAENLASQVPLCHTQRVPTGDRLAPYVLYGPKASQRISLEKQESRISNIQGSGKNQCKMTTLTYKSEEYRRPDPGHRAEWLEKLGTCRARSMCPNAQARGTVDSVWRKYPQLRPERKQVPPESFFRKRMKLFYQWISPHGNLKSEDTLQKYRPKLATAQSQGPAKRRPLMHSKTAEAQALVTAVGQMLEDKMDIDHGLHTTKLNEHKQELQTAVCGCFCHHSAPFYPEKGRMMTYMACGHQASSNSQSCSTGEGQVRHRQPLKSAQFNDEQPDPSDLPSLSSKKALFPVSPCQYRPKVPGVLGHHQHCPRHCPFRGGVLPGQPRNASLAFPGGKTYLQEKNSVHVKKTFFSLTH